MNGKFLILTLIFTLNSHAADQDDVSTFGQLDALRSQNALLEAQVKNAELKSKLTTGVSGSFIPIQSVPDTGLQRTRVRTPSVIFDRSAKVELVSGMGSNVAAKIAFGDGTSLLVRVGTKTSALGLVKSISANEVVTQIGKETYSVPFAQENQNNINPNSSHEPPNNAPGYVPNPIPLGSN